MVAISLYRGNLHKVPEAPRRWVMPKPRLSLRQFRALLARRDRALHVLIASSSSSDSPLPLDAAAAFVEPAGPNQEEPQPSTSHLETNQQTIVAEGGNGGVDKAEEAAAVDALISAKNVVREEDDTAVREGGGTVATGEYKGQRDVGDGGNDDRVWVEGVKSEMAGIRAPDLSGDQEKQKSDLEQKLENLNKEKHHLVQMLKQVHQTVILSLILNAEEEIKRRHSMQASLIHMPVLTQIEASTNTGSMTRQPVQRPGSDINSAGELEGESEDASNPHARIMHQMCVTSPAGSPLARPAYDSLQSNAMTHPNRAGYTTPVHGQTSNWLPSVSASPSRFAPSAGQGHTANLPPLSMSGIQFTASTPSPAASTGTSAVRDTRPTNQSWSQR